jgi:CubicO group peptidase (beta-lactamase class C family)
MESGGVTGLSIAITADTGIIWSRGYGSRNVETGDPVDTASVFEAASLSKPVFAYAFLQLVDEGIFDLDSPIAENYEYAAIAHEERRTVITPRMVLTHSPGFPNWRPRGGQLTINFEPGSEFSYSGEGFVYLQRAVMHVTGEPLNQLASRLVFEPLGMQSSSYVWRDEFDDRVAMPHNSEGQVARKYKPQRGRGNAAASLHTTASDFARFIRAMMNGAGLSDSTAAAMLSPQIDVDSNVTWGLGIGLQDNEHGRGFWHWGDNTGYKAYTLSYPERGLGVVWFTNSEHGHAILDGMLDLVYGGDHAASVWLGYEQYDSPVRFVREELERVYADAGIDAAIEKFHQLKEREPADAFDEFLLNSLGYRLMRNDHLDDAIAAFELNVAEYPDASNPYDSLGEAYLAAGDTARAIANYQRSVEIDPSNTNGAAVLERLRGSSG